jgi:hypothetical protein
VTASDDLDALETIGLRRRVASHRGVGARGGLRARAVDAPQRQSEHDAVASEPAPARRARCSARHPDVAAYDEKYNFHT